MVAALLYLGAITIAEIVTNFTNPFWGIVGHTFILIALIVHSSLRVNTPNHRLYLSLTLSPLTRILSLSVPLTNLPLIYWYMIIYPTLIVATFIMMRRVNYKPAQVGLTVRKPYYYQGIIALSGIALGVLEFIILRPQAIIPELTVGWAAIAFAVTLLGTGLGEEIIFRGVAQRASIDVLGKWGVPYMAYIFAILHLIHHSPIDIFFVLAVGLFFGWAVNKTGSILGVTVAHGITNFLLYAVIPFAF